ncbi:1,4-alpha-glucan branching enzyme [Priestia taiwanensis]|uniref:1,4-alpha-glucan branching enzyme GlgB n=1 Tax=Priestia taiwanensis TaxID=1347902 RepID=A0A917AVB3_9BACI|nr:1,4-alpha-glucan branching enzyme [Priestia taiwanensis]MBM7363314.1 1,4-alpha-glucan branching enzyme [Priestia taiwanensis]GGE78174.1 1,4-alpha-glucan branching enzyme GlgB [Priestia taiwanensis]
MDTAHLTDYDIHLFHEGSLFKSYHTFGAHRWKEEGLIGTRFSVWAPHAKEVRIVGDFNKWIGTNHQMKKVSNEGVWALFIPEVGNGSLYKYEIVTKTGDIILKADPYAYYSEMRPQTASIVYELDGYKWKDKKWLKSREKRVSYKEPLAIYEVHFGSWRLKEDGTPYSYRECAEELIPYVKEHGFTHIEIMPLVEHPYDRSWGYQGTGYFAVTSRYGTPQDLMYFIDECHQQGIGVILDWVPGHFCKDAHGLYMFDGTPTYEYESMPIRENAVWGTANFDLGKPEVQSFLISNAMFWMEYFHIDGFRVDAVANMLYWNIDSVQQKNEHAVTFFRRLNEIVFNENPNFLMMAEDSTDWPMVTWPTDKGGLGFNYKWNMGWMNDMLTYMECEPENRKYMHEKVTFSILYAFSENFILPLSHDEVVHGKKSLLNKMPGDYWRKFAQLRLLYGYMMAHPGKKLLFMGGEFGQFDEWKDLEDLDWNLFEFEMHEKMNVFVKDLLAFYKRSKPLWQLDYTYEGFEWVDVTNREQSIFSFLRKGENEEDFLLIVCNFTEQVYMNYRIGVPDVAFYNEVLNSDDTKYGGSGQINKKRLKTVKEPYHNQPSSIEITIPPFGISIIRPVKSRKGTIANGKEEMRRNVISRGKRE